MVGPVEALGSPRAPGYRQGRVESASGGPIPHGPRCLSSPGARSCQTARVGVTKFSSTDAFLVVDLDGAERADGVVRLAPKVLPDGAATMARSRTYSWALLGERISGASAGINAAAEDRDAAISAFVGEVAGELTIAGLALEPGKGLTAEDLAALRASDNRSVLHAGLTAELLGAGIAAVADVALGGLAGATAVVEGAAEATGAVSAALATSGVEVVATGDGPAVAATPADLLVCGSKLGLVDHELADVLPQRAVVACGAAPVTAKGLAVAGRRGIVVMADFLSLAAPLLALRPPPDATAESLRADADARLRGIATGVLGHADGPYLGAAYRAEEFLRTWRDELPFGRPLA